MSVYFYIKDTKHNGDMTIGQISDIAYPVTQCEFNPDFGNIEHALAYKINSRDYTLFGQPGVSARGFNLSFDMDKNSYCVEIFLPCSISDFKVAFDFIKTLCNFLGVDRVFTEKGEEYSTAPVDKFKAVFDYFKNISARLSSNNSNTDNEEENTALSLEKYPHIQQIISGLKQTLENLKMQTNKNTIEISGIARPVSFNEKMLTDIISSHNPAEKFSEFITNIQNLDAYSANQKIFINKYIGFYQLVENIITVLPYKPKVDPEALLRGKKEDVSHFELRLIVADCCQDNKNAYHELGQIKYTEFIERLPKDKYKFIDANHILIEGLSRREIENLLV